MPSPIAHVTAGYAIYRLSKSHFPEKRLNRFFPLSSRLLVIVGLSMLPDLDVIPGILLGDISRYHNNAIHSPIFGLIVALAAGSMIWLKQRSNFWRWLAIVFLCYEIHVVMDYFTFGRGIILFWPFSLERYEPAIKLFHGLRRSEGWLSIHHLWTLATESGFALIIISSLHILLLNKKRLKRDRGTRQLRHSNCQ